MSMKPDTSDFDKAGSVNTSTTSYQIPLIIFFVFFGITTPIYLFILVCILKWRKNVSLFQSTFYTILIQHSIADIISLVFYAFQKASYILIPYFLYNYQRYRIAAVFYDGIYWSFIIRTNGIALMTIHRFSIIVKPMHKVTRFIQQASPWKIWIIYWVPSLVFSLICFSDTKIGFDSPERMILSLDASIITKATRISFIYVSSACVIGMIVYGFVIRSIRNKSQSVSRSMQREIRLVFQVSLSFAAQLVLMVYLMISFILAEMGDTASIVNIRRFFPMAYGTISFIGPFTILIFNKDVLKRMRSIVFRKIMDGQLESSLEPTLKRKSIVVAPRN